MKHVSIVVCGAGKELLLVVLNHLQDDFEFASDYISFQIPDDSFVDVTNCIAVVRGMTNECEAGKTFGRILLCIPPGHCFVDLALFEDNQIAMLLNKMNDFCESLGDARMMILQAVTFHLCILQEPIVQITESCTN